VGAGGAGGVRFCPVSVARVEVQRVKTSRGGTGGVRDYRNLPPRKVGVRVQEKRGNLEYKEKSSKWGSKGAGEKKRRKGQSFRPSFVRQGQKKAGVTGRKRERREEEERA